MSVSGRPLLSVEVELSKKIQAGKLGGELATCEAVGGGTGIEVTSGKQVRRQE